MRGVRFVLLLLVLPAGVAAQTTTDDPLAGLDAYVRQAVHDWEVPGLAVAVVKDDSVVFARGYGLRALGGTDPVDVHTLFANASTTKAFTAMAIAMLVDEGKLEWNDRVADHVTGYLLPEAYPSHELTIRDLLTHRVGFGDPGYLWYGVDIDFPEIVDRLRFIESASSFRSRFAYNNVAYATAGIIAGRAADTSWDALVRERILEPLGMTETVTQGVFLEGRENVAAIHDEIDDTLQLISGTGVGLVDPIAPAGSMYSNVMDMTRWLRFLLNGGEWGDERLVGEDAFAELFRPQVVIPVDQFYPTAELTRPRFTAYGLGWFLQDYRGAFVAFHTGSIDGTVAIVGLLPDHELGVVVFANRDHAELRHALMLRVFDLYLGDPVRDWSVELQELYDSRAAEAREREEERRQARVPDTEPSHDLAAYTGIYAHPAFGSVEVRLEDDALVLDRSPFLIADLTHWHYDVFQTRWRNRWIGEGLVTFNTGTDGEIVALKWLGFELRRQPEPDPP
ncbi:MAG: serine hydrolase [Gemmatimonadetes bacterium]|uniref:Serine hydrolase n=1 Tax=Candidatus Kutchimonas denitrificans TaxID=3056748 RepID=A0AAE4Z643_9BACT|nr:serine hydrolase [Gemmatimonadota bacterium]NIR74454.1 serine hydrolase [Candidatus Kutchimonas denitrificans]NIS00850.1 serine hydrolase [Gemmatimonadota bacterium]NIT66473.1 serine hydrolase [Gemmatimonadota bacterium]NIU52104.1 serine hydrolase [Gemmatimonadota bacterium]